LPHEGASGLHQLFRESCLFAAMDEAKRQSGYAQAIKYLDMADSYPENLGTGQPYDHDFSLTSYIKELMDINNRQIVWHAPNVIVDFDQYLKNSSLGQKEAFIAHKFYQQLTVKK
jgi:hypothetical protein